MATLPCGCPVTLTFTVRSAFGHGTVVPFFEALNAQNMVSVAPTRSTMSQLEIQPVPQRTLKYPKGRVNRGGGAVAGVTKGHASDDPRPFEEILRKCDEQANVYAFCDRANSMVPARNAPTSRYLPANTPPNHSGTATSSLS